MMDRPSDLTPGGSLKPEVAARRRLQLQPDIETDNAVDVKGQVFRLFTRDGTTACTRELWVRFDWTANGWEARFFRHMRPAIDGDGDEAMTAIPAKVADLAVEALQRLKNMPLPSF